MDTASSAALLNWAEKELLGDNRELAVEEMVWKLSGVPDLYHAIADRIDEGVGQENINRIARRAINLANGVQAKTRFAIHGNPGEANCHMATEAMTSELDQIEERAGEALTKRFDTILQDFHRRLDRAHKSFLDRATAALVTHLETHGDEAVWSYDPTGLRILLRSAYQVFGKNAQSACDEVLAQAATDVAQLYGDVFATEPEDMNIETPAPPRIAPPILLGQTIALDLKGTWWTRWWQRRRGYRAYAMEFADMIRAETDPIIMGLKDMHCGTTLDDARHLLEEFLSDQKAILLNLAEQVRNGTPDEEGAAKQAALTETLETLNKYAA